MTRHAGNLQEGLRRQAEDIKVELRRPHPLVFDEEEKLGSYFYCSVLALACVKSIQILLLSLIMDAIITSLQGHYQKLINDIHIITAGGLTPTNYIICTL